MTIVNAKDKGDRAERALVDFLDHEGFAARRIIAGAHDDIGDIDVHPDIVIEVKNRYKVSLGEYLTALWAQKGNKDAAFGFVAIYKVISGVDLNPEEGALFMLAVKLARISTNIQKGTVHRDSLVDAAGYLWVFGSICEARKHDVVS